MTSSRITQTNVSIWKNVIVHVQWIKSLNKLIRHTPFCTKFDTFCMPIPNMDTYCKYFSHCSRLSQKMKVLRSWQPLWWGLKLAAWSVTRRNTYRFSISSLANSCLRMYSSPRTLVALCNSWKLSSRLRWVLLLPL